jgi:hypothetical protein
MRKLTCLPAFLVVAILVTAKAQDAPPEAGQAASRIAELAELRLQIELTSARVEALLARLAGTVTPEEQARINRTFRNAFNADAMYEDALAYLRRQTAASEVKSSFEKLNSPLVKRMIRLEVEATRPENRGKIGAYAQGLNPNRASVRKRLQLLSTLDEVTRTSEHLADLNIRFTKSFTVSLIALSPPEKRPAQEEQEQLLNQLEAKLKRDFEDAGVALFLYAFRSVPDAELEQYVRVCETQEGRWFAAMKWGAMAEAFHRAGERFGAEVATVVND